MCICSLKRKSIAPIYSRDSSELKPNAVLHFQPKHGTNPGPSKHQLPSVELNLSDAQMNCENAKELQDLMNRALQATEGLAQAKCSAVTNRRKERVGFVFANEEQAQMVRNKEPWQNLTEQGFNMARLIKQERFKVKLTGDDKDAICNPSMGEAITRSVVDQINRDNGINVRAMRILSKPSDRRTLQLVLVCSSQDEKDSLLSKGYIAVEGTLAYTSEFFESDVLQCKKCGEFNHMARNCQNPEKCLNCSEQATTQRPAPLSRDAVIALVAIIARPDHAQFVSDRLTTDDLMNSKAFRILQASLQHQSEAQHALLNDEALQDFGVILIPMIGP